MAAPEEKPSLPESYKVPEVWTWSDNGGMNRPIAGPRSDAALQKGEHAIQLYSLGTPNGQKVTILLEELGVEYDAWIINIMNLEQFTSGFVACNPNSKIPTMWDYNPDESALDAKASSGEPLRLFESGSILVYLAEKYGNKFIPTDRRKKVECMNWLMWQMGSAPFLGGGFGHFYKYAPVKIEYAIDRYSMEAKRLFDVLDRHLGGKDDGVPKQYVCGDEYTIADMAIMPWIRCVNGPAGYQSGKFLECDQYTHVNAWMERILARKAVQRGIRVNGFSGDAVPNRHSRSDFAPEDYE
jgi:GST-like protein